MIIWLVGMSGSGKTTIGAEMVRQLNDAGHESPWLLVDGDMVRALMGSDLGHSVEARRKNAERIIRLCDFLDAAGLNAVACILSIFPEHQVENRGRYRDYRQVYIRVDYEILKQRDNKHLYLRAERGEIDEVVGVQIPFPEPAESDVVLDNDRDSAAPSELAMSVLEELGLAPEPSYSYTRPDLLDKPQRYQYTAYDGAPFLSAYRANRESGLEKLRARLKNHWRSSPHPTVESRLSEVAEDLLGDFRSELPGSPAVWMSWLGEELLPEDYRARFLEGRDLSASIVMREWLVDQVEGMSRGAWSPKENGSRLATLIQRFEVGKRIYVHCNRDDLRRIDRDDSDHMNYPLFHALLVRAHAVLPERKQAIVENSLLKVGDILVSSIDRLATPGQTVLSYCCVASELALMKERYGI